MSIIKPGFEQNLRINSLCINGNQFATSALNELYKSMFDVPQGQYAFIDYTGNPGSDDADNTIWQEKNWLFQSCRL